MLSTRRLQFAVIACTTCTIAFEDFTVDPTCVPMDTSNINPEIFPHICQFDADAEDWSGFDCTDIPAECEDGAGGQMTWALTKIYKESQGTDKFTASCHGMGNGLSRDVEFPQCVFGEPVPETRVGDLLDIAVESRAFAEQILSTNPTHCAISLGMSAYTIYGVIAGARLSEVAKHGLSMNPEFKLAELREQWVSRKNDCTEEAKIAKNFRGQGAGLEEAMALHTEFKFSRKAFNKEECTLIRRYNGSSFAKPHPGGLLGCRVECLNEENCNAFNFDLQFGITIQVNAPCDLLECPPGASKVDMDGYVGFERVSGKPARAQRLFKKGKRSQGGLRRLE